MMNTFCVLLSVFLSVIGLSHGAAVIWTGLGGNSLWNEPRNWDGNFIPRSTDDVVINLPNTVANVLVGPPPLAQCNSLVVGGNSPFQQTLALQGPVTVGKGGGSISGLGSVVYNSAPDSPFTTSGTFTGGSRFTFSSGTLAGTGSFIFTNVSFAGAALKVISTTVTTALLYADPGVGSTGSISINGGTLLITDTLKTTQGLTIVSATPQSSLKVTGTLSFAGTTGSVLTILGNAAINSLSITGGTGTLNDNVSVTSAIVAAGAALQLIGAPGSLRTFGDITGAGTLAISGGVNTFKKASNIGTVSVTGGQLVTGGSLVFGTLSAGAGVINGSGTITASLGQFANIDVISTNLQIDTAQFGGFSTLDGASLTIGTSATTSDVSQLTLANGATFTVSKSAKFSQSFVFRILPSGNPSLFVNNGLWTSTAGLSLVVPTQGVGSFEFGSSGVLQLTGISFTTGSVVLANAASSWTSLGSNVVVGTIDGNGSVQSQGQVFTVLGLVSCGAFTQQNGNTQIAGGSIGQLVVSEGIFNITGPALSVTSLTWTGGQVSAGPTAGTAVSVGDTTLSGGEAKTLSNILLTTTTLKLACDADQCQLFTSHASLTAKPATRAL